MSSFKTVTLVLFCTLLTVLAAAESKEIDCPTHCHCSTGFTTIKCRGMDRFPVFDFATSVQTLDLSRGHIMDIEKADLQAYKNLHRLDLRHNEIQSVSPGLFSEMKHLKEIFIDGNPWSCDPSTMHVLQEELTRLLAKNSHLENFDGGRIKCDGPVNMKGTKPLHMKFHLFAKDEGRGSHVSNHKAPLFTALIGVMVLLVMGLVSLVVWIVTQKKLQCLKDLFRQKKAADPVSTMEAGETDTQSFLIQSMKKQRRMSQGIPEGDIVRSDDEEVVDKSEYVKEKMKKLRRRSQGFGEDDTSSEEETCMVEINLEN